MEGRAIAEGIEHLCLGEELEAVVVSRLVGGVPPHPGTGAGAKSGAGGKPGAAAGVRMDELEAELEARLGLSPRPGLGTPASPAESPACTPAGSPAGTPAGTPGLKRHQRRRNRRERRRGEGEELPPRPLTRVEKLRAQGVQRSSSERCLPPPGPSTEAAALILFKSQSSACVNTGVRNLPQSFFSDQLPEEEEEEREDKGKRRKGKKRSKAAAPDDITSTAKENADKENIGDRVKEMVDRENMDKENIAAENLFSDPGEDCEEGGRAEEQTAYNWRNVVKNGDIKKCVLVEGVREGGRPGSGDVVLVKSQGKLRNGTMIDDFPTLVFRVGEYEVIEGLDLVVQSMYKNELAIISIKPCLAYGELGRKPDVPPESRITYLFGLLHFEKQKEMGEMTWAQRRKMGQSRMRIANWWYARKGYPIAVKCYKKALQFYNNIPTNQECSTAEEYKELLTLMEERLRVMRQVANIFKRIANLIQSGQIEA